MSENLPKAYLIEHKSVSSFTADRSKKNAGGKNEGIFHYVIENTCSKNARNRPLHYVIEKKYSYRHLSIMLLKINGVIRNEGRTD